MRENPQMNRLASDSKETAQWVWVIFFDPAARHSLHECWVDTVTLLNLSSNFWNFNILEAPNLIKSYCDAVS
ncbi:hypothetical protein J6590_069874 [Homalodisca vitripennis]|nr:hypothetical protein J6590_069874 [Homalodisca vitripennis]